MLRYKASGLNHNEIIYFSTFTRKFKTFGNKNQNVCSNPIPLRSILIKLKFFFLTETHFYMFFTFWK